MVKRLQAQVAIGLKELHSALNQLPRHPAPEGLHRRVMQRIPMLEREVAVSAGMPRELASNAAQSAAASAA